MNWGLQKVTKGGAFEIFTPGALRRKLSAGLELVGFV
jgi:hypothetical protein